QERIKKDYSDVINKLESSIKDINSSKWKEYKKCFLSIQNSDKRPTDQPLIGKRLCERLYSIFNPQKILSQVKNSDQDKLEISDQEFVQNYLFNKEFDAYPNLKNEVIDLFRKEYFEWKDNFLLSVDELIKDSQTVQTMLKNFQTDLNKEKNKISENYFIKIFDKIKEKYNHNGYIDLSKLCFRSFLIKISVDRLEFQFQRVNKLSLGHVKPLDIQNNHSEITGQETRFHSNFEVGDCIIIENEKKLIVEIISNNRLKIEGCFSENILNKWHPFKIWPKTKLNRLIDIYADTYEKFPINPCIDNGKNKEPQLFIFLDCEQALIPIQIAIARENKLIPLYNGLDAPENYIINTENDDEDQTEKISYKISFGWYEGIFKYYDDRKIKAVSSMAITEEVIYVALDFEGIGSSERHPQEDVPKPARKDIKKEFEQKFQQIVAKEGIDNFISRIYSGEVDIYAWPMFNEMTWYTTLEKVKMKLDERESTYDNANYFDRSTGSEIPDDIFKVHEDNNELLHNNSKFVLSEDLKNKIISSPLPKDSQLLLYKNEDSDLVDISKILIKFFGEHIMKREDTAKDETWFNNLCIFLDCIVKRHHNRDHNCLTDHKCHFICQFDDKHSDQNPEGVCKHE
ncbi:19064_t:CDS:2, partial [Racocetra fulgida]